MQYETTTVDAISVRGGDQFTHHGREWTAIRTVRGWYQCAEIITSTGTVWMVADRQVTVRRPVSRCRAE
ncbi:hypothetical protein [Streptomyces asiaticus]|uniref:hypothetical protein n=1 Tax=Streptomyces asiaticus TaxID=114695 RepID=UPI001BA7E7C2|nr:hypothetical protein [Streptomyces asiaticus]